MHQIRPGCTMNGTVDTTSAKERGVRGVNDGINSQRRDIALQGTEQCCHG